MTKVLQPDRDHSIPCGTLIAFSPEHLFFYVVQHATARLERQSAGSTSQRFVATLGQVDSVRPECHSSVKEQVNA
jgi:hypothetical protein